jgi:glycosyltransferase involved in cell wall biosynthesis
MKILWLTWKDRANPTAGGAEIVAEELGKRLAADGHELVFLTAKFKGSKEREFFELPPLPPRRISALEAASDLHVEAKKEKSGYWVIRVGGRISVYWQAFKYFQKHLSNWPDLVIEEINTFPFFSNFYTKKRRILFFHMLCREIWFHEMFFPASFIGFVVEPIYLRLLGHPSVITVSESSRKDLKKYGFKESSTNIISEGIEMDPVEDPEKLQKSANPTIVSLGSIRSMKRTLEIVQAFEIAKKEIPNLTLKIAGDHSTSYAKRVLAYIHTSPYRASIEVLGKISLEEKIHLLRQAHLILVTSIKEGWGLVVTEAASQGTPAVVYNVDGLRDSVKDKITGIVCLTNSPGDLARSTVNLLHDQKKYDRLRRSSWEWAKEITFDRSYQSFKKVTGV